MTREELQKKMKETQDKMQNDFIDKLYDEIEYLLEKFNRKDYEPTEHEREVFNKIHIIINNINKMCNNDINHIPYIIYIWLYSTDLTPHSL